MVPFVEAGRGQVVTIQDLVIHFDSYHLRFDILSLEQIENGSARDFFRLSIDFDLHGFSQVGLEIKEFRS